MKKFMSYITNNFLLNSMTDCRSVQELLFVIFIAILIVYRRRSHCFGQSSSTYFDAAFLLAFSSALNPSTAVSLLKEQLHSDDVIVGNCDVKRLKSKKPIAAAIVIVIKHL